MTPRWLTIEKLVVDLGGVCTSQYELRAGAATEAVSDADVTEAVSRATSAVGAVVSDRAQDDDEVVRTAWFAMARAQDSIARLRSTVEHARALRERAQWLQDQSLRLRSQRESSRARPRPARRATDRG